MERIAKETQQKGEPRMIYGAAGAVGKGLEVVVWLIFRKPKKQATPHTTVIFSQQTTKH
jgi:hypothetical protein